MPSRKLNFRQKRNTKLWRPWLLPLFVLFFGASFAQAQTNCPTPPSAQNAERCGRGDIVFTATMGNIPGKGIRLYDAASGGALIAQSTQGPQYLLTAPSVARTANFWLSSFIEGCESPRTPVTAFIGPENVPAPTISATTVARCGPGPVNFLVQNNISEGEIRLYTQALEGEPIIRSRAQGLVVIATPPLNESTSFWIATNQGGCESPRVLVTALITNPFPQAPISSPVSRCGPGTVTITAQIEISAGSELRLYDSPFGGNLLDVDESFPYQVQIPNLAATRTFWLAAATNGCEGPRVGVIATIRILPDRPTALPNARCQEGRIPFAAQMGNIPGEEIRLYTTPSGGTPVFVDNTPPYELFSPAITTTTTFWLASANAFCESGRAAVVGTVLPQTPGAPTIPVPAKQRCQQGTLEFTASMSAPGGEEIRLYDAPFGGNLLQSVPRTTAILTTPVISADTDFWVSVGAGICEGPRVRILAQVTPLRPAAPTVSNPNFPRCGIGGVTFTADLTPIPGQVLRLNLYTTPAGGNPIATTDFAPYQLSSPPFLTSPTSYWLAASTGACESPRTLVVADVAVITPSVPQIASLTVSRCGPGSVVFSAAHGSVAGRDFRLYTELGELVASSAANPAVLLTPSLTASQNYILVSGNGACESPRTRVTAVINELPQAPRALNSFRCGPGEFSLALETSPATRQVLLYRSLAEQPLFIDDTPPFGFSLNLTESQTFFAIAREGSCQSQPATLNLQVRNIPPLSSIQSNAPVCNGSELNLSVAPTEGVAYRWTLPDGNVNVTPSFFIPNATQRDAGAYTVVAISQGCTSAPQTINVIIRPTPTLTLDKIDIPVPDSATGTIFAAAAGGEPIYNYRLNNVTKSSFSAVSFSGLAAGNYTIHVTDAQGCASSQSIEITRVNCNLAATSGVTDVLCKGEATGKIDITVSGGTLPYRFDWSNGASTEDIENLRAGSYTGRITDKNGCSITATFTIQEPAAALALTLTGNGVSCIGCNDGLIIATPTGGVPPYRYFLNQTQEQITSAFAGLAAGTYAVTVRDFNFCNVTETFTVLGPGFTDCNIPPAPAITALSGRSARITWQPATGATQYQIGYKKANEQFFTNVFVTNNTYTFNNLEPFTEYEARVRTYCVGGGVTEYSAILRFFTSDLDPCTPPGRVELGSISASDAFVYWSGGIGVSAFELQYKALTETNWQSATTPNANFRLTGLMSNTAYQARVRRICGNGLVSNFTETLTFQTLIPRPCLTPSNLNVANIAGATAQVFWTDNEPGQNTQIEWRIWNSGGNWNTALAQGTNYLLTGLQANTEYEVRIRKVCADNTFSAYTLPVRFISGSGCQAPALFRTQEVEATAATLTWQAIIGAQSYEVYYREVGAASWARTFTPGNILTIANLRPGVTYEAQVRTFCDPINSSAFSPLLVFTTLSGVCRAPESLTLTPRLTSVSLSWPAVSNGQSYQVAYRINNPSALWSEITTSSPNLVISGLISGTEYQARLRTNCGNIFSNWSNTYLFNTASFRLALAENKVRAYPNPTAGRLFLQLTEVAPIQWSVYDLKGVKMLEDSDNPASELLELKLEDLPNGIYQIRVQQAEKIETFRILKQ
jgi:hypothetical protein